MICRLCLVDLNDFVSIFNEDSKAADTEVAKIINKYFQLELKLTDPVSTKICQSCWQQLRDFHQFELMVTEKQQALQLKTEQPDLDDDELENWHVPELQLIEMSRTVTAATAFINDCNSTQLDTKDGILCEPEIDATLCSNSNSDNDLGGDSICSSDDQSDSDDEFSLSCDKSPTTQMKLDDKNIELKLESTEDVLNEAKTTRKLRKKITSASSAKKPKRKYIKKSDRNRTATTARSKRADRRASSRQVVELSEETEPCTAETLAQREERKAFCRTLDEYIAANVKLECCLCSAPLKDFMDLKQHFRAQHNCSGYVKCCNKRYKKRTLYVDHLHFHKDPDYFKCTFCLKSYLNRNSYDMHMLRFHSNAQELTYECDQCNMRFAKSYLLTMHKKNHKGTERKELCKFCDKAFRTPDELKSHEKRMHDADFTPVICDICGAHFRTKANFIVHKQSLHREGPPLPQVQCHLCGRWVRDERSLRRHIARHGDPNATHKCTQCGMIKATRTALVSHIRYHHSGKTYKCSVCSKEFKLTRALKEHMATHTGLDLYKCDFCTRTFKSYANMHNHKKKMHPNLYEPKHAADMKPAVTTINADVSGVQ